MRATDHTDSMIAWWKRAGVDRADLAIRRPNGAMLWHQQRRLDELPLGWARAENASRAEVYIRPARGYDWPLVFLDDVPVDLALRVSGDLSAMVIQTSPAGGCHLWIACDRPLAEPQRKQVQLWLAEELGADPGSVSGEHLGRLAGFKNWKRAGSWVNVLAAPSGRRPCDPSIALSRAPGEEPPRRIVVESYAGGTRPHDTSPSGTDWGWVCASLEAGCDPETVYLRLVERARDRRGSDAQRYARRTVEKALMRVATRPGAISPRERRR